MFLIAGMFLTSSCVITVNRQSAYLFCNPEFIEAEALAKSGQWQEAAELWSYLSEHAREKTAARSAYNMIWACEMMNRDALAVQWAKKVVEDYDYTPARMKAKEYLSSRYDMCYHQGMADIH